MLEAFSGSERDRNGAFRLPTSLDDEAKSLGSAFTGRDT